MSPRAVTAIFFLLPSLVLVLRLCILRRFGWALVILPIGLLVVVLTFGIFCEGTCPSRATFNELAVSIVYFGVCISALIATPARVARRTPRWKQKPQARDR